MRVSRGRSRRVRGLPHCPAPAGRGRRSTRGGCHGSSATTCWRSATRSRTAPGDGQGHFGVFDATPEEVFRVATDYAKWQDYLPRVKASQVIERQRDGATVEITIDLPWPVGKTLVTATYHHEKLKGDIYRVKFTEVRGNLKQYLGSLYIEPVGAGPLLAHLRAGGAAGGAGAQVDDQPRGAEVGERLRQRPAPARERSPQVGAAAYRAAAAAAVAHPAGGSPARRARGPGRRSSGNV